METKKPGVYIVEKPAFPPSVVEVATAVPAFIGYTAFARNDGKSLLGKPWRISSLTEYERHFGGAPQARFRIEAVDPAAQCVAATTRPDPALAATPVSQVPDMVEARGQRAVFMHREKHYLLTREAGKAGGRYLMHQAMRHFFQNGGGSCYVVSVGDFKDEIAAGHKAAGLVGGLTPLQKEQEPTMVVVPDAVLLSRADCVVVQRAMLEHCGRDMKNRVAIVDVWGGDRDRADQAGSCIDSFRADLGVDQLDYGAAYYPWLHTSLVQESDMHYGMIDNRDTLVTLLKTDLQLPATAPDGAAQTAKQQIEALDDLALSDEALVARLRQAVRDSTKPDAELAALLEPFADATRCAEIVKQHKLLLHQSVAAMSDFFTALMDEARRELNVMPPAAAMAGIYTMVDNTRGVWKAPANVSVAGVIAPTVAISHEEQEDLNVTAQGKSINAIRSFAGEGVLVWGARTLDGNSLDWRYINVRRTMIMLEESCRLAAQAMVFEPNVADTWATVKSMITNFLTGIWKRGGLMGAVPDDAFSVHCGLGETMTPEDLLEGILRVTVLVAMARPAEFIEITFQQQMAAS